MANKCKSLSVLLLLCALAGCSGSLTAEDFANTKPAFAPEVFFAGHVQSWGMVETASGAPDSQFTSDMHGHIAQDGALLLTQVFTFSDGKVTQRDWRFVKTSEHHYEGTANDVVGTATGDTSGNLFHWRYTLALSPGNPLKNVGMEQWMYLQEDGSMINQVVIRKLGFTVALVMETFRKLSDRP